MALYQGIAEVRWQSINQNTLLQLLYSEQNFVGLCNLCMLIMNDTSLVIDLPKE